ncbi:Quinol monooxygenase YgiN [Leifsonia sp. 98AMF]|uniref:putative quinol monooxygenase n=1 Tax=unclassified Leifsonia TaxID=2663824 RepID=UPI00087BA723|nr:MULTISPECIES: antibiotic biosynthesis monooxygenase [unclassified Leifsonia]SDH36030.1 Quinol monooxygenase YgiN [Leifsonia sp. 197AMF]SDI99723.1 Quinol monooxygenase YgiN [Leifsonia sp. 466MF]SDJ74809.1 Quinol monooxygenase YgiN [Leifsonia sp. 157MF]SDO03018.1 Quinol monooxygenase YgiN [Leifsonia sp. 509MF]SEN00954.1 Quinol monooxygenase YgiN [Leifsonia sp. 467MF]
MELRLGVLALLEAKPDKAAEVKEFLIGGKAVVDQEPGTRTWYAFQIDDTHFGIFDTFGDEDARQAHLNGAIPQALGEVGPNLLAKDPELNTVDLLAVKHERGD